MPEPPWDKGPRNDPVVRSTIESHLIAFIDWISAVLGWPSVPAALIKPVAARFPLLRSTREADLLTWVGPDRLLHVEYETAPRSGLWLRMLEYRYLCSQVSGWGCP